MSQPFYLSVLRSIAIPSDASVLVVCGGRADRDALLSVGVNHATISNLDERMAGNEFAPYDWSFQDAEALTYANESFDYVIVHAGLHHCASPHRALLEMYRVARRGILAFEARDNLLIDAGKKLGLTSDYEISAVLAHRMKWGGVRNTCVPNYVYRWTEKEVIKTIQSYAPHAQHEIKFFHGLSLPYQRIGMFGSHTTKVAMKALEPAVRLFTWLLPKQCNLLAFYVAKPSDAALQPWMKTASEFNPDYGARQL